LGVGLGGHLLYALIAPGAFECRYAALGRFVFILWTRTLVYRLRVSRVLCLNLHLLGVRLRDIGLWETFAALLCGLGFLLRGGFNLLIFEGRKGFFGRVGGGKCSLGRHGFLLSLLG